jgi:hypothetical protein
MTQESSGIEQASQPSGTQSRQRDLNGTNGTRLYRRLSRPVPHRESPGQTGQTGQMSRLSR